MILSVVMILLLVSCAQSKDIPLYEILTSHKRRYSAQSHQEGNAPNLNNNWLLECKDDGTWEMDTDNSVDDYSASHTLRGTWKLDGSTLTVVKKDKEAAEFNTTETPEYADDMTDEIIEKNSIDSMLPSMSDYSSMDDNDYIPEMKRYVSDKYFCFYSFLFKAE